MVLASRNKRLPSASRVKESTGQAENQQGYDMHGAKRHPKKPRMGTTYS